MHQQIKIYNTLTQKKELLKPIESGVIKLYVCGMTVYDFCHIGHARVMIVFDVVVRFLRSLGYKVIYIRNITDIDDKIINRAHENKEEYSKLTERFIKAMHEDTKALGLLNPDAEPRATEYIQDIIALIQNLFVNGYAYTASNGDVYFSVSKFKEYGKLSHKDLEGLRAGARIDVVDAKQEPLDFVLWKQAKAGEPSWPSPWGEGRPGWHIECSAMSIKCLGEHFDIHGGGFDLQFPHHENEIAQSEGATGKKFVDTWMHVGFLQIDKQKMSKSLGNFFTIRDVLKQFHPEVMRFFMITSHYRNPVNYSQESLELAKSSLAKLYLAMRDLPEAKSKNAESGFTKKFNATMCDDFNTPQALAVLFEIAHEINRIRDQEPQQAVALAQELRHLGSILGILQLDPKVFLAGDIDVSEQQAIEKLIAARNAARQSKDWQEADRIRDQLAAMGITIEDASSGTKWRRI